jgi:hypothetical protein
MQPVYQINPFRPQLSRKVSATLVPLSLQPLKKGAGSRRTNGSLHKAGLCQLRHVSNIRVGNVTAAAHYQHGGNALQINIALFNRHRARRVHHGRKLIIGQTKHAPEDNPEKAFCGERGPVVCSRYSFVHCP